MPENNEFGLTFGFLRNKISEVATVLAERKELAQKNSEPAPHRMVVDLDNVVNQNAALLKAEKNKLNETIKQSKTSAPADDSTPGFIKNHAAEKGIDVNELVNGKTSQDQEKQEIGRSTSQVEKDGTEVVAPVEPLLTKKAVRGLGDKLKERVFGQDSTIEEVVDVLTVAALDIQINEKKPAGCYFMAGSSGVGKTELAQSLADALGVPLIKMDMGEFGQEQDVAKLLGAAPGLVGYKEGGKLTKAVRESPRSVVLFDEIEKAHPDIYKILLSIMNDGICTGSDNLPAFFKHTIVICTSNVGAEVEYQSDLTKEQKNKYRMAAIKQEIPPEIINRFDSIFQFDSLTPEIYKKVSNKFLTTLSKSMATKHGFELKYSPAMIDYMVTKSFDPSMGGRPARRFIEKIMIKPLAKYMLEDEFEAVAKENKQITLDLNKAGNICFKGKNKKILGVLDNTAELVEEFEANKFTQPKKEQKAVEVIDVASTTKSPKP